MSLLGEILVQVTFWICALYPLMSLWWPWWKSQIGVTIIAKTTALALVLLPAELRYLFGLNTATGGWQWFALACFAALPAVLVWRAVAIYLAQKRGARES